MITKSQTIYLGLLTVLLVSPTGAQGQSPLKGSAASNAPLQGAVRETIIPKVPGHLKMSQAQYDSAVKQFRADINQFYIHAKEYNDALKRFKIEVADCNENEQLYKNTVKQNQLNLKTVQINGVATIASSDVPEVVPPPRACCPKCVMSGQCRPHLGTGGGPSVGGGGGGSGGSRADEQRLAASQAEQAKQEQKLANARAESAPALKVAVDEAKIASKMEILAGKFGKLKEEFKVLRIERDSLTGAKINSGVPKKGK